MKKLLICLLLVCFIATNFAACTKQGSVGDINTEIDTSENTHTTPPRVIVFESVEELIEHKNLLNKSEEEKRKIYVITELGIEVLQLELKRIKRLYETSQEVI